jgi:hypothetical protein
MKVGFMASSDNGKGSVGWTYKDWYERNKDAVSERRKARYQADRRYRKQILTRNREYRQKKLEEEIKLGLRPERSRKPPPGKKAPVIVPVKVYGRDVKKELLYVGMFADGIKRSVATVYYWERIGLLPKTPYFFQGRSKKERLYTDEMVDAVRSVMRARRNTISASDPTFHDEVLEAWRESGVPVEEIQEDEQG